MSNRTVFRIVLFGALSIVGILGFQAYWFWRTWDFKDQEFNQRVHIALLNTARELARYNRSELPARNLVRKLSTNYYVVNINDAIDAGALEYYLSRELEAVALTSAFEYGIYDCASDQMVYGNSFSFERSPASPQAGNLPKYDQFLYYFGVRFPDRTSVLLADMPYTLVFSAILLLTIVFFVYSLAVILRQKRLSELQKDFIDNMTHEFNTPISTIRISAEVLARDPRVAGDDRLAKYTAIIREQNDRLHAQVDKVLQLTRLEKGSFRLRREDLDLHQLLDGILPGVQVKVQELGGSFETSLEAQQSRISADRFHLQNIVANLLDNAVKYRRDTPRIRISTRNVAGGLQLAIRDEGIGIPKDDQARIFGKFYRVSTGNVHDVKGFGLGLYYVRGICQAHGWEIRLQSEPRKFTVFTIEIPTL